MARSRRLSRPPSEQSTEPAAPVEPPAPPAPPVEAAAEPEAAFAPEPAPEPAPDPAPEAAPPPPPAPPAPKVTATITETEVQMGALPDWWTQSYPEVASVTSATAYLDGLGGSLSRAQDNGRWVLSTGDQALYVGSTPEELDSFILGFALSQLIAARHGPIGSAPVPPPAGASGVSPDVGLAE